MTRWVELALDALESLKESKYSRAIDLFEKAIACEPVEGWPYVKYADLLLTIEDFEPAIELLEKAMQLDENPWGKLLYIEALNSTGRRQEALKLGTELKDHLQSAGNTDLKLVHRLLSAFEPKKCPSTVRHFMEKKEGRLNKEFLSCLPHNFETSQYKNLNPDLKNLTNIEAALHFAKYGKSESRLYKTIPVEAIDSFFELQPLNQGYKPFYSLDEDWGDWDRLQFNTGRHIYRFDTMFTYYTNLVGNLVSQNKIDREIARSVDFSAPQKHYELLEVLKLNEQTYGNPILNTDLLRVFDTADNKTKHVIFPFISFPDKGILRLPELPEKKRNTGKIWDYHIINLKHRSDNLDQLLSNIKEISWLHPMRFEAIVSEKGYIGCLLSHLEILRQNASSCKSVLIVEDDNIILNPEKLKTTLEILDAQVFDWDIFMGSVGLPTIELTGVVSVGDITFHNVTNVTKANFVYYNKSIISKFLKLETFFSEFNSNLKYIDRFINLFNVFTCDGICTVKNTFSEIEKKPPTPEAQQIQFTYERLLNKERKIYGLLPKNFLPTEYQVLNPDLENLSEEALGKHFLEVGLDQRRYYAFNLPSDFNWQVYKAINPDLNQLSSIELKRHYQKAGFFENRRYKDPFFDAEYFKQKYGYPDDTNLYLEYIKDIRQLKNGQFEGEVKKLKFCKDNRYVFLVNHDNYGYGAGNYLYNLYKRLRNEYKHINIKLCEINYSSELETRFGISKDCVLEYRGDPTLLYLLYERFKPELLYLNSCNHAMATIIDYLPEESVLLHSHEIFEHYMLSKKLTPDYVVSQRIAQQYELENRKKPSIQPPFLDHIDNIYRKSQEEVEPIGNQFGYLDSTKITVGMAGQVCNRKNFQLFKIVSNVFRNLNFVWIGGEEPYFEGLKNVYHIKYTQNPYKYFRNTLDYFVLFTLQDPCPYVILENILLGTQIITFRDNIFFDHKHPLTQDFYFEYPGEINLDNCVAAIKQRVKSKKTISSPNSNQGLKYIQEKFSAPNEVLKYFSERFNTKDHSSKNRKRDNFLSQELY